MKKFNLMIKALKSYVYTHYKHFFKKKKINPFFVQKVKVSHIKGRISLFNKYCKDKVVIHFGCTDYPIFNPHNNLHIKLSKVCLELHGFDIDLLGIKELKKYVNQHYYSNFNEIKDRKYDVCLIPETIEHVENVGSFLRNIDLVNAELYIFTAPNCFSSKVRKRFYKKENIFHETVHPDHNAWYSPYTLKNVIEKYTNIQVEECFLCDNESMVICTGKKKEH